jgi:hypothetical protein
MNEEEDFEDTKQRAINVVNLLVKDGHLPDVLTDRPSLETWNKYFEIFGVKNLRSFCYFAIIHYQENYSSDGEMCGCTDRTTIDNSVISKKGTHKHKR